MSYGEQPRVGVSPVVLNHVYLHGSCRRVEHCGHLVADQPAGAQDEGAGEAGVLELAVADFVEASAQQVGGEADGGGEFGDPLGDGVAAAGGTQGLGDQVPELQSGIRGQPRLLEDDAVSGAQVTRCRSAVTQVGVDLPQRLGPRRPTASPGSTVRETSRTTGA